MEPDEPICLDCGVSESINPTEEHREWTGHDWNPVGRDDALLGAVLRRFLGSGEYVCLGDDWLTLDGRVSVTPEEHAAILRVPE